MRLKWFSELKEFLPKFLDKAREALATMDGWMKLLFDPQIMRDKRMFDLQTEFQESKDAAEKQLDEALAYEKLTVARELRAEIENAIRVVEDSDQIVLGDLLLSLEIFVEEGQEEVSHIGHTNRSETESPTWVEINGQYFCDCPGYQDRSGNDISITNTVKMMHFVREA